MVKFAICNELFKGWGFEDVCRYVAGLGYHAVEVAPFTLTDDVRSIAKSKREGLKRIISRYGLKVAGLHWLLVKPEGLHINHPDPEVRTETVDYLKALAEFCGDLGGEVMVFGSPRQRNVLPGVSHGDAWRWTVDAFKEASEHASEHGVVICIEPLRGELTNFITTVEEALRLIEDVNHPNFRLILDVYFMSGAGRPIREQILMGSRYLSHVHANDDNRGGPGFGSVDYREVAGALREIGYEGYVSVEVLREEENPGEVARVSLENLKRFFRLHA